jgi:translocation and assembly module TamB
MKAGPARTLLLTAAIVIVLLGIVVAWALTSDAALRWAVARINESYAGRLVLEGVDRTGVASFTAKRILYVEPERRIEAHDTAIVVSVASLWRRHPVVNTVRISRLQISQQAGDDQPVSLPETLRLPVGFTVESLRISQLGFIGAGDPIELRELHVGLAYEMEQYILELRGLATPWAALNGTLRLGDSTPYPIEGGFDIDPVEKNIGPVAVQIGGELAALGIGIAADVYGSRLLAKIAALPFSPTTLAWVEASVAALETTAIAATAPRARLDVSVEAILDRTGAASGRLQVLNTLPGLPADSRVPVQAISASFSGAGSEWALRDVDLDAGRAGRLTGDAMLTAERIVATLRVQGLNLRAINATLHATALNGPVRIDRAGDRVAVEAVLQQPDAQIEFNGAYEAGQVKVAKAQWRGPAGRIEARGATQTQAPYEFQASGRLTGVDPSLLGDYPAARLNATFESRGRIEPIAVDLVLDVADSRFRNQPLAGGGRLRVMPERIENVDFTARLGRAQAHARGSFGAPGDRLTWDLTVPDLAVVDPAASGSLKGNGMLAGAWHAPAVDFTVNGSALRLGDGVQVASLRGNGALAQGLAGRIDVALDAQSVRLGELTLQQARLLVDGTRTGHEVRMEASAAEHRFDLQLAGALDDALAWRGTVGSLQVRGPIGARLEQPVDLMLSASAVRVGAARLALGKGHIELAHFDWTAEQGLASAGALTGVALSSFHPALPMPVALRSLVMGGQWDVTVGEALSGKVSLRREAGDIVVPGKPEIAAGLSALTLQAQAQGGEILFEGRIESGAFGRGVAQGSTRASRRETGWGIAGDAPLEAKIDAVMPTLEWARPLLGEDVALAGRAELALGVRGTISQPTYTGQLQADQLVVRLHDLGLTLRDGVLAATFDEQKLVIQSLRFASGAGEVTGTGNATLVPGKIAARMDLKAHQLTVLARPDRLVVLSGQTALTWDQRQLRAQGRLTADRAVIELPREDTPRPSTDVVVLGAKPVPPKDFNIQADIALDLGQNFSVRGRGISTRLAGTLRAQLEPEGGPVLTGTIRTVEGTYTAFGQRLDIQRGVLTFVGPVDNPSLDVLAVRTTGSVEVGVAVGGTALLPQVRLVSTPPMSDANKLAWLTLGHGLDQAGQNQAAVLQAAAMALLSRRGSGTEPGGTLANRFGLDELTLGTVSGTGEQVVSLGKRLSSQVYLGFEQGITGAVSVLKITYDLSRRWSVQARAGSENAVDLFYTLGFR